MAVDIPSGADADAMGPQTGTIARADAIVTFTAPRPAHVFSLLTTGPTYVAEIGSPEQAIVSALQLNVITARDFATADCAAPRGVEQRKLRARAGGRRIARQSRLGGDGGDGCVARRSGTGDGRHVEVCVGNCCRISSRTDDRAVGGDECGDDLASALVRIEALAKGKSVLAIGPGISRDPRDCRIRASAGGATSNSDGPGCRRAECF